MNMFTRILILFSIIFFISNCSYVSKNYFAQNRDKTYLAARSIPPLQIPPGIHSGNFHSAYPVSSKEYPIRYEDVSVSPPGLN